VSYPNVGCQYDLRLVSSTANQVELYEEITSGLCEPEAPPGGGRPGGQSRRWC
jgi:hypothetical protein